MMAYLGESMEDEYDSVADAIMFYFEEADAESAQEAVTQAEQIAAMSQPMQFIRDNDIVWNFAETDDEVRRVMNMVVAAGTP
ncbi:MAG: hypothetical protein ACN6I5_01420 [Hyphomicrobiales bacterium]